MITLLVSLLFLTQAAPAPQNASPSAPAQKGSAAPAQTVPVAPSQNGSPAKPTNVSPPDPAATLFTTDAGLVLVAIKPPSVADYELAIRTLQEELSKTTDQTKAAAAKGWRVFKSSETDAKGNTLYVHWMLPTVLGFDYRPSLLIDELLKELAPELLSKYQDAFAMPPARMNLTEFANMAVAPLPVEPPDNKKPPETKKPPG